MSEDLAELIARARSHVMTPAEIREQRVSFVYGQVGGSKDKVREMLASAYGWEPPCQPSKAHP